MTAQVVVDTCSAMNFAAVDRMPLFETALRDRGRWTQAVEGEIYRNSNSLEFRSLKALIAGAWLGEAIELDSNEDRDAIFLTDDGDAQYAAGHHGITVKDTRWLLTDAYSMGDMLCPEPYRVLEQMWKAGRNVDVPTHHKEIC